MERREPKTQEEARQYAIDWQNWVTSTQNISYSEIYEWQLEFEILAHRFDLIEEFKENGLI